MQRICLLVAAFWLTSCSPSLTHDNPAKAVDQSNDSGSSDPEQAFEDAINAARNVNEAVNANDPETKKTPTASAPPMASISRH